MHLNTQRTFVSAQGRPQPRVCPRLGRGALRLSGASAEPSRSQRPDVARTASQRASDWEQAAVATASTVLQDTATPPATGHAEAVSWGDSSCCCEGAPGHAVAHDHLQHAPHHIAVQQHHHLTHLTHHGQQHQEQHQQHEQQQQQHLQHHLQQQAVHSLAAEPLLHAAAAAAAPGASESTGNKGAPCVLPAAMLAQPPVQDGGGASSGAGGEVLEVYRSGSTAPLMLGLGNGAAAGAGTAAAAAFTLPPPRAVPTPDTRGPPPPGPAAAPASSFAAAPRASTGVVGAVAVPAPGAVSSPATPASSLESLSSVDSDGEMCMLVPDPEGGDIQMVCDSDPAHPISLAEEAVLHPLVPSSLLQDIEHKLEADLSTIAVTIVFAVGFVCLEFGVNDLIEIFFGHSLISDLTCIGIGLTVVFGVKVSRRPLLRLDRWN